jgi:hypothetical protein
VTDDRDLPVLADGLFQELTEDAGEAVARAFMEEYFRMLPVRAAKIFKGLSGRDVEPTLEALISLKVSSAMAGALRLEEYCRTLENALKDGHDPDTPTVRAVLFANIRLVIREASRRGYLPSQAPNP